MKFKNLSKAPKFIVGVAFISLFFVPWMWWTVFSTVNEKQTLFVYSIGMALTLTLPVVWLIVVIGCISLFMDD